MNKNAKRLRDVYYYNLDPCWVEINRLCAELYFLPEQMMQQKAQDALRCIEEIQTLIELRFEGQIPEEDIPF